MADSPNRPSVEQQIASRQSDPKFQLALNEDQEEQARRNLIIQKFRLGAKQLCASEIWRRILKYKKIDQDAGREQARKLGMISQQVNNNAKGDLAFASFIAFLSDLERPLAAFDDLPILLDRAVAGYQRAAASLEHDTKWIDGARIISKHDLLVVCVILANDEFQKLTDTKNRLELDDWTRIADSAALEFEKLSGGEKISENPDRIAEDLAALHRRYGEIIGEIREAIPHRWMEANKPR